MILFSPCFSFYVFHFHLRFIQGSAFTQPFYDVHVKEFSDKELVSILQYYRSRKWISKGKKEKRGRLFRQHEALSTDKILVIDSL